MIQSGKFDSFNMNIKKLTNSVAIFIINRLIEIFGLIISILGILLLISLISYSPSDPNFIFPENTEIKNFLGFRGSYISDLFLQSVGFIAYLIPITYIFTGINIFRKKEFFLLISNSFYIVIYSLIGSLFFCLFYKNAFDLYINGNGGFIGTFLSQTFLKNILNFNNNVSYFLILIIIILIFLLSVNFSFKVFTSFFKKISKMFFGDRSKNYTNKNEIINEYIPQEEIKNLIQDDLPFIKTDTNQIY